MASLYFCVWEGAGEVACGDPIQEGVIDFTAGEAKSSAIAGQTRARKRVRLWSDTDCFVTWGVGVTADTSGTSGRPMSAQVAEYFECESGYQISVIAQ